MSRLLIVTTPQLATGFHLAGVAAFAVPDAAAAQQLIGRWLDSDESGLLVVDEAFLADFEPKFLQRLATSEQLPYLALPGGRPSEQYPTGRSRIVELLRQAIGFHISFRGDDEQ